MGEHNKNYIFGVTEDEFEDRLEHYGTPRHSGRYPWGSGKNPQRGRDVLSKIDYYKSKGFSEKEIAVACGYKTTSELRAAKSQASAARQADEYRTASALMDKYNSYSAVAREMGRNESSIRSILKPREKRQSTVLNSTMQILRDELARVDGDYIDVGKGSNLYINVSPARLNTAVKALQQEGYAVHNVYAEKMDGSGKALPLKVLCPKGTTEWDVKRNKDKIHLLQEAGIKVNDDTGKTIKVGDPISIDSKRVWVRYAEEGGADRDGTIELRQGVPDLNLGKANYAQVRILVDDNKYMKGMAYYSDDVPEGYDIIYNTNKSKNEPNKVFKKIEDKYMNEDGSWSDDYRPVERFGALIKDQNKYYIPGDDKPHQGALNIVNEEGGWSDWSDTIASQFLGKQRPAVAKQQLSIDYANRAEQFDEIKSLTNPVLKQALLQPFADECDSAAVELKAAAFPRQAWHAIMPNPKLKENEIYAPNYQNGEKVILVRYPHAGPFESPELIVNNNSRSSKAIIGKNARDAVVINKAVADRLSGADFDGDTVLVIPNNDNKLISKKPLKDLENFDTKAAYPHVEGTPKPTTNREEYNRSKANPNSKEKLYFWPEQLQMGMVSNLITDMTLKGATDEELARAVKHSMVVIDVRKHHLDWQRSERENGIQELKNKYQAKDDPTAKGGGASTLLSRSKSEERGIVERRGAYTKKDENGNYIIKDGIDVNTGEKVYAPTGRTYSKLNDKGEWDKVPKTISSTKMYEAKDARELMSGPNHEGYEMERIYADYANKCKALGNQARKEFVSIELPKRDPAATKKYAAQVESLKVKLNNAKKTVPVERLAQLMAAEKIKKMRESGETHSASEWKKEKAKAVTRARQQLGASRYTIKIEDDEWEAIQANAVSPTTLKDIFAKTDLDALRKRAMPREKASLSDAKVARIKAYANAGRTQKEIADTLGISLSSVNDVLHPKAEK